MTAIKIRGGTAWSSTLYSMFPSTSTSGGSEPRWLVHGDESVVVTGKVAILSQWFSFCRVNGDEQERLFHGCCKSRETRKCKDDGSLCKDVRGRVECITVDRSLLIG